MLQAFDAVRAEGAYFDVHAWADEVCSLDAYAAARARREPTTPPLSEEQLLGAQRICVLGFLIARREGVLLDSKWRKMWRAARGADYDEIVAESERSWAEAVAASARMQWAWHCYIVRMRYCAAAASAHPWNCSCCCY